MLQVQDSDALTSSGQGASRVLSARDAPREEGERSRGCSASVRHSGARVGLGCAARMRSVEQTLVVSTCVNVCMGSDHLI